MEKKVLDFMQKENIIPTCPIICAVSGGVDSICLLNILHKLNFSLILAHVNHHKREESFIEQKEMEKLALKLNIPFELLDYYQEDNKNFQAKAHDARYEFFKKLALKYNTSVIATAHHLDDQAETIIMRLIKGSNLYGYGGISILKNEDEFTFIRPLLCLNKDDLYKYAVDNNLKYFEDCSNNDDDYLRNRIRHHILPLLKKESVDCLNKIQEFSIQSKEAFNYIRKDSINYLNKLNNIIEISSFNSFDIALKKDIICLLFEKFNLEKNYDIILKCIDLIKQNKNCTFNLKDNYNFIIEYKKAYIDKLNDKLDYEEKIDINDTIIILDKYKFYFSKKIPQNNEKYLKLCYNSLKLPFFIRNRKDGDFICFSYGTKKVSRVMIDCKIPASKRNQYPLIFDNDGNLLWIYNLAKNKLVQEQKQNSDIYFVCEEV